MQSCILLFKKETRIKVFICFCLLYIQRSAEIMYKKLIIKIVCAKGIGTRHMDNRIGVSLLTVHLDIYFFNHVNVPLMNLIVKRSI